MYAVIRESLHEPDQLPAACHPFKEYQAANAQQSGYLGTMVVDVGGGRFLSLTLWEKFEHADAAREHLTATQRTSSTSVNTATKLVGRGDVVVEDLLGDESRGRRHSSVTAPASKSKR